MDAKSRVMKRVMDLIISFKKKSLLKPVTSFVHVTRVGKVNPSRSVSRNKIDYLEVVITENIKRDLRFSKFNRIIGFVVDKTTSRDRKK